jgi:hypothetical protein
MILALRRRAKVARNIARMGIPRPGDAAGRPEALAPRGRPHEKTVRAAVFGIDAD